MLVCSTLWWQIGEVADTSRYLFKVGWGGLVIIGSMNYPSSTQQRKQAQRRAVASESVLSQNRNQSDLCTKWLFTVGFQTSYTGWDVLSCQSAHPACTSVWVQSPELHKTGHGWHMSAIPAPGRCSGESELQGQCLPHPEASLGKGRNEGEGGGGIKCLEIKLTEVQHLYSESYKTLFKMFR